ncbi:hypothetical protein NB640_12530 [Oxalobacter vibrioformis]|uniref:Uncharacterized protein n=1 Tax=Oxalobacter vibrioformis TaxID=933080 RepID=A0A9E9LWA9_9BURK|nr:hypothetical protein [Oxalobacter vibrioformis]WAW10024.1 hypothetical protein NB640_12530 [Oxalobacter vibrioformis]
MNDTARKPLSDLSLHLRSWGGIAMPADELRENMNFGEAINRVLSIAHVILFCRRPRFAFDPAHFSVEGSHIACQLLCRVDGQTRTIPFSFDYPLEANETAIVLSPFPHREIHTINGQGDPVRRLYAHGLSQHPDIVKQERWVNELEVLYAGNVYEEGTALSAFERVRRDASLQGLLAAMREALPDDDILVYAFEYLPYDLLPMPGALKPKSTDRQEARFLSTKDHPLSEFQKICMAQASLIAYFGPAWNVAEKRVSDPASEGVFQSCEALDFSGVVIEVSTVRSHFRLYSRATRAMEHHMHMMDLSDQERRAAFFAAVL